MKVKELFLKIKKLLINKYGNKALYGDEIDEICKCLFQKKYKGSFAQNEKFPIENGYYIINTDLKNGAGIHWIALIIKQKTAYVYDTYGRKTNKIIPHLYNRLISMNYKIKEAEKDKEQKKNSNVCGHLCIAWLYVANKLGINKALTI